MEKMYFSIASLILCLQSTVVSIGRHMTQKAHPQRAHSCHLPLSTAEEHKGVNHRGGESFPSFSAWQETGKEILRCPQSH